VPPEARGLSEAPLESHDKRHRAKPGTCDLCERVKPLTFHHLIPRRTHRRRAFKRRFDKDEMRHSGLWLCQLCHAMLHRTYDEVRLGAELNTRAALLAQPEVARFLAWVKKQR
jgi:hypothetical protein